jgi:hypothetical protein
MPTWVKVVLVVVLVGFAAMAVGLVVAARWLRHRGQSLARETERISVEAEQFGKGKDGEACVTESLARLKNCDGFICEAKMKMFLVTCLNAANTTPETCKGVPNPNELVAGVRWQLAECSRRGFENDQRCTRLVQGLQVHCASAH